MVEGARAALQIHAWSNLSCCLDLVMQCAQLAMASGSIVLPPGEFPSLEDQPAIMRHLHPLL